ncbi:patatin-like phospholipase family protein [Iodobacter sp. LRB]|uniref:patatin-like phospholipase family protein n=1 Tax=unclassified Iodobacter TaxID=235634 RepID=UPI000C0CE028|nr:patatin-like phospholipase family protein [Iodobacter sp. BJB302]PHV00838.1 alpha/beta hydrolase [Iodobacter sp. BJB302]
MARTALIISGGAPNSTLIAGALEAFHELGVKVDVISTAGAGALLGLMYIAPKNGDVVSTLRGLKEMGVADFIYRAFPVNFKVFHKPGPMAEAYRQALAANPLLQMMQQWPASNPWAQTLKDGAALAIASASPSDLSSDSLGLCAHVPFAEQIIDFEALKNSDAHFWLNAYNLSQHQMENWPRRQIDLKHLQAALSFPYLYPPTEIDGDFYIEGAAIDCLNFKDLRKNHPGLEEIIVFDLLGAEKLLRKPKDLYDAWVMSIITPLVEIARDDIKLFEALHSEGITLHKVPLIDAIAEKDLPDVFDWSRSNMDRLYQTGYQAAKNYAAAKLAHLIN